MTIPLNPTSEQPMYQQIYYYIRQQIQSGKMLPNTKLPSSRLLSEHLQVSRSTIVSAYEQLIAEGYLESRKGSGVYVLEIDSLVTLPKKSKSIDMKQTTKRSIYAYDFSPRGIDLDSFPYNTWRKITRETLNDNHRELFTVGDSKGELNLRHAIARYLYAARGVQCSENQIIVGAGMEYLLLLLNQILEHDGPIAMETPTYIQAWRVFQSLGHPVVPISLDGSGMKMEELYQSNASIAYVMPSHQYPTGIVMPIKRRMELLAWTSQAQNRYLIEDDYDSEFRYKGKPIPSLQGADNYDKVIYIGTFSKSIAPAIRISYMVLPKSLLEKYYEKCSFYTSTVSRIDQEIVCRFLQEGYYERHLNKMRAIYKNKHDVLLGCLKDFSDDFWISGEDAGLHILLTSKKNITEKELIHRAEMQKVRVYGMSAYEIGKIKKESCTVILGYANMTEETIQNGMAHLKDVWLKK